MSSPERQEALERARSQAAFRLLRRLRHDLATPLSGAALHLEMSRRRLSGATADPVRALESVQLAQREVGYTSSILQPLSDVFSYAEEPAGDFALGDAVRNGARRSEREAARRSVTLELPEAGGPRILGMRLQSEDAFAALTAEAVRRCREQGTVVWSCEQEEDGARAVCRLAGRLGAETLDSVFATRRSEGGGADLSLVLARWALESQGAVLSVSHIGDEATVVVQLTSG